MPRTRLQLDADERTAKTRAALAEDLRRLRADAGVSLTAAAVAAGVDRSVVSRIETGALQPTLETYGRLAAALGADLAARVYPQTGPAIRDRHQVRMAELLIATLHPRWLVAPEVAVRRPVRGWIDLALHAPADNLVVAAELESELHRVEQLLRWSSEKAEALASSSMWASWTASGQEPRVSRLLVLRWTRANRHAAAAARRLLREAYPAEPQDALESLAGPAAWPGAAMVWARIDGRRASLVEG
ncbi:MAG: helix-turn-helix transcriptional regulator [Chloroflexota bacterium]